MTKKERYFKIKAGLDILYPDAGCSLVYKKPHELLISTILAAQCTDKRVNIITKTLYKKYTTVSDFANADYEELCEDIKTAGLFRTKLKILLPAAKELWRSSAVKCRELWKSLLPLREWEEKPQEFS